MQLYVGNDIISTERIKEMYMKHKEKFLNRIYTEKEIEYCNSKGENKFCSYAARFAAKEAIFKAISSKIDNKYDISWRDIEILNDELGKPHASVKNVDCTIDISLSHEKEYAIATAIAVFE